jgi:hypothetical protein
MHTSFNKQSNDTSSAPESGTVDSKKVADLGRTRRDQPTTGKAATSANPDQGQKDNPSLSPEEA